MLLESDVNRSLQQNESLSKPFSRVVYQLRLLIKYMIMFLPQFDGLLVVRPSISAYSLVPVVPYQESDESTNTSDIYALTMAWKLGAGLMPDLQSIDVRSNVNQTQPDKQLNSMKGSIVCTSLTSNLMIDHRSAICIYFISLLKIHTEITIQQRHQQDSKA